ncbi:dUTP diphosphatase [Brooklawnia cerclae]|uniref:Deoxyuridine 5'-triphosphate nucleotidohydrolase n=1 Tax=Brooklawnia cerclae TaxID=349934 RepID=A0ABX0SEY2_9ACTN|nr:dUTP pyrophosphatase [Brooklawnia cerclae]
MSEQQQPTAVRVEIRRIDPELPVPRYAHPGDAGADLATAVDVVIEPGQRVVVPTGIALGLPDGYAGFVHPRSGLAARSGLTIVNTPGTLDSGYRGEIRICLLNTDRHTPIELHRGDLVAQLIVQRVEQVVFVAVDELPDTVRGSGGYGSTGGVQAWSAASGQVRPPASLEGTDKGERS